MLWKLLRAAGLGLALALFVPQGALGAGAGSFGPTGSMGTARYAAVAAPLKDGRVLVAGGYYDDGGGDHYLASAEIFDPAINSFSSAGIGPMGTPRRGAIAAPLPDGRVLVAGGSYNDGVDHELASAEVFNPATNSFSSAGIGAMSTARTGAVAAPLPDGRVLVAGGYDGSTRFSSAEIFAATNTFSFAIKGRKLLVNVQASGRVSVNDAAAPLNASSAKKKKRKLLLRPSDASGDPPTITVPLHLSKLAKQKLRRKGKLTLRTRITFAPQGGLAKTETAKLRVKG
jgi:hypothetical protein